MITTTSDNYLELQISPVWEMDADRFFEFCQLNSHLRIEQTATGKLIIMPPTGSETGNRNFNLKVTTQVAQEKTGS